MLTLIIFIVLIGLIVVGVPIYAAMGLTTMGAFLYLGQEAILPMLAQRMYYATTGFTLLAIPFFILAGNLMNYGGITHRVFRFATALVGNLRGGLGHVNVVSSMIFSGMSGAAVADASGLGLVELEAMRKAGYDRRFSAAITAASSTIGPVVPPSIAFVVYGTTANVSVGRLFLAGCIPGVLMGIAMMIAVYFVSKARNYPKGTRTTLKELLGGAADSFFALLMPLIIVGGILSGFFTPTEAAVVASIYALILGCFFYKEIKLKHLPEILWETVTQSVKVLFIISIAGFLGWMLILEQIPLQVIQSLTSITETPWILLLIINFILLVLGCFMEGIAVMMMTIPVFIPLIKQFDVDPVQFGVVMILCSMLGLLTPPVGLSMYAVSSISNVSVADLTKELWPYLLGIFIVLLLVTYVPQLSMFLPNLLMPRAGF